MVSGVVLHGLEVILFLSLLKFAEIALTEFIDVLAICLYLVSLDYNLSFALFMNNYDSKK